MRIHPHPPLYFRDAMGVRWRVYDQVPGATPELPRGIEPPGAPGAVQRLFVREGDRWVFSAALLPGEDPGDLRAAALARQLERALGGMPWRGRGEAVTAHLRRQYQHMAMWPERFPSGRSAPRAG